MLDEIAIATAAASLPFPPIVSGGDVSTLIGRNAGRGEAELDIELWSAGSVDLTAAELFGGALKPGTVADTTFAVDHTTEIVTVATSGLLHTGDGPVRLTTTGILPSGLALATDYYWIRLSATTGYWATSLANALSGTKALLTDNGTGTHTLSATATTKLMKLMSCGLLGTYADGVVSLTIRRGYNVRINHRPTVLMYWISATLVGAGTVNAAARLVRS